ncbi:MAG: ATP-binding protein [Prevotellaceae bacterium]|jgi:predicted ATPase|nr:ATP-binding protein [Prevotellaceae bacterium]
MIRHVKIEKLWGQYDIEWSLYPDVNILAGINGSGKSTLLRILDLALTGGDGVFLNLFRFLRAIRIDGEGVDINAASGEGCLWYNECGCDFISTFDKITHEKKALTGDLSPLSAYLDAVIFDTQRRSLNEYRLKATESPDEGHRISHRLQQWIETVNGFFAATRKTFVIQGSEVFFRQANGERLALHALSAGEKQLLVILINALTQDGQPFTLLMDEPEISLDIDWQYRLVDTIRTINPACQLIIATHSPAIFGDGWNDKLFFMDDILKK